MDADHRNISRASPIAGAIAGAFLGAFLRFLVAASFLFYVEHWGASGKLVREANYDVYQLTAISAVIGLLIGGIAGFTCHPIVGTILGGFFSAGSCYGLFVLPVGMFGRFPKDDMAASEVLWGWLAMTIAGAVAGGIGAIVGKRGWNRASPGTKRVRGDT